MASRLRHDHQLNVSVHSIVTDSPLFVTSDSEDNSISMTGLQLTLVLSDISISATAPLAIHESSATVVIDSAVILHLNSETRSVLSCASFSNDTLGFVNAGALVVSVASHGGGIGPTVNEACNSIELRNCSMDVECGIVSGLALDGNSFVFTILISSSIV
jgi:hypothetical protein